MEKQVIIDKKRKLKQRNIDEMCDEEMIWEGVDGDVSFRITQDRVPVLKGVTTMYVLSMTGNKRNINSFSRDFLDTLG